MTTTVTGGIRNSLRSISELRALDPAFDGRQCEVSGGGVFRWDASSTYTDDGVSCIAVTGVATGRWLLYKQPDGSIKTWTKQSIILPLQRMTAGEVASMGNAKKSRIRLEAQSGTMKSQHTFSSAGTGDLEVYFYGEFFDTPAYNLSGLHVYVMHADTITGTGGVTLTGTVTRVSPTVVKCVVTAAQITKAFLQVRIATTNTEWAVIDEIVATRNGSVICRSLYNLIPDGSEWASGVKTGTLTDGTVSIAYSLAVQELSHFQSSYSAEVSNCGSDSILTPPYKITVFRSMYNSNPIGTMILHPGNHTFYRAAFGIGMTDNLSIIAPFGRASLLGGIELKTSSWVQTQSAPHYAYSAPYDWDSNHDSAIRAGTKQPFFSVRVPKNIEESSQIYELTPVASAAAVLSNPFSVYYDHATKTAHFSFGAVSYPVYVYVTESDAIINMGSTQRNFNAFNVDFIAAKDSVLRLIPSTYTAFRNNGKFVAIYNCGFYASSFGNGVSIDNIDSELVDCAAESNGNDGINMHTAGMSYIKGGRSWCNNKDGMSHHESTVAWVEDFSARYNGAGSFTPAYGATVYHKNCESVSPKTMGENAYSGQIVVLAGQGGDTTAWFDGCYHHRNGNTKTPYYVSSQAAGDVASIIIANSRANEDIDQIVTTSGDDVSVTLL